MRSPAVSGDGAPLLFHKTLPLPGAGFVLIPIRGPMLNSSRPGPPYEAQARPRMTRNQVEGTYGA